MTSGKTYGSIFRAVPSILSSGYKISPVFRVVTASLNISMYLTPFTNWGTVVGEVNDVSNRPLIIGLSRSRPDLVVTIITPLAPRVPYNAVAVASFKMEKLSITSGSNTFKSVADACTPSITINGEVIPLKVEIPLIQKSAPSAPGSPERCTATTPANRPANPVERFELGTRRSSTLTVCTAPTILAFFCVP
ncbi:hypothetical protein D3C81_1152050 [compost metagenome]